MNTVHIFSDEQWVSFVTERTDEDVCFFVFENAEVRPNGRVEATEDAAERVSVRFLSRTLLQRPLTAGNRSHCYDGFDHRVAWALEVAVCRDCIQLVRREIPRRKATAVALSFSGGGRRHWKSARTSARDLIEATLAACCGWIGGIEAAAWRAGQKPRRVLALKPQTSHVGDRHERRLAGGRPELLVEKVDSSMQLRRAQLGTGVGRPACAGPLGLEDVVGR